MDSDSTALQGLPGWQLAALAATLSLAFIVSLSTFPKSVLARHAFTPRIRLNSLLRLLSCALGSAALADYLFLSVSALCILFWATLSQLRG